MFYYMNYKFVSSKSKKLRYNKSSLYSVCHSFLLIQLFIVGGYDATLPTYHSSLWCLDLRSMHWTKLTSMEYRRCYIGTCVWRDQIVAIGGHDGQERHRAVERYDPQTNIWHEMASLNQPRSDAAVVNFADRIFVIGGFDGAVGTP